jgi:hypothetical protein
VEILMLYGELYVSFGIFRGFSAKTVHGVFILKSGLFRKFFSVWVGNPVGNKKCSGR